MKSISLLALVVLFAACSSNVKFVPKTDTGIIVFWASKKANPVMYVSSWYPRRRLLPTVGDSTRNEYRIDTAFRVRISDTTADGKGRQILDSFGHSIPVWVDVPDSVVNFGHFIPRPNK